MTKSNKCRAAGGPASCSSSECPEKDISFTLSKQMEDGFAARAARKEEAPTGWGSEVTVLYQTIHGSTLYGLAGPDSDEDYYTIVPSPYIGRRVKKHLILGEIDSVVVDFKTFNEMAEAGAPQALETMFSREAESEYFEAYRNGWHASSPTVVNTYLRTIKSFALTNNDERALIKYRRHALRLATNLAELIYTGRFNPKLSPAEASRIKRAGDMSFKNYIVELKARTPLEVDWKDSLQNRLVQEES